LTAAARLSSTLFVLTDDDMKHWPLASFSATELAAQGAPIVPSLVAALASDAKVLDYGSESDFYGPIGDTLYVAREVAAKALERLGAVAAVAIPNLLNAWMRPNFDHVARACHDAILALAPFAGEESRAEVAAALVHDLDAAARTRFARAATTLGGAGRSAMFNLTHDVHPDVRIAALVGLAHTAPADDIRPLLVEARANDVDQRVRSAATHALVELGPPEEALRIVLEELGRDDVDLTLVNKITTLGSITTAAVAPIAALLVVTAGRSHASRGYRVRVLIDALAHIAPAANPVERAAARRALASVFAYAQNTDGAYSDIYKPAFAAFQALGADHIVSELDDAVVVRLLSRLPKLGLEFSMVTSILNSFGATSRVLPILVDLLRGRDESTRAVAAAALGASGESARGALPALRDMMKREMEDPDSAGGAWKAAFAAIRRISGDSDPGAT
jgi:hypothetical protein